MNVFGVKETSKNLVWEERTCFVLVIPSVRYIRRYFIYKFIVLVVRALKFHYSFLVGKILTHAHNITRQALK